MRVTVVGAGPTGLYSAIALARRGHDVTVIDRDAGPDRDGAWSRRGVMQFHHPHAFRQQVLEALWVEMPEVVGALFAVGAVAVSQPDSPNRVAWLRCRREVFERVLRSAAAAEPGVMLRTGRAGAVIADRGSAVGIRVDGRTVDAELIVDASGRAGRLSRGLRGPAEGGDCGVSYVSRQYQLLPGAAELATDAPIASIAHYPEYIAIVFFHEAGTFSTLVMRASADRTLALLRHRSAFDAAAQAIPNLAVWTDPARSRPITPVLPGGRLHYRYQGQLDPTERPILRGLVFLGDAVCTTNPRFGRGVATSLMQAQTLVRLLDEHRDDAVSVSLALDHWCEQTIKPWFTDQVYSDAQLQRRWAGHDVDLTRPLPSNLIVAAAEADPQLMPVVGPYLTMQALPASLDAVQAHTAALYAAGWRPPTPPGPTCAELAELVTEATTFQTDPSAAA